MHLRKHFIFGWLAAFGLLSIYFALMSWLNSWPMALIQFRELWPWMMALSAGFGIQIGMFTFISEQKKMTAGENANVIASGSVSSASMVACCMHHLTDIAPLLGISALTLFASKYQVSFLLLGIFSNLFGIVMMAKGMKGCITKPKGPITKAMVEMNHGFWLMAIALIGAIAVVLSFAILK